MRYFSTLIFLFFLIISCTQSNTESNNLQAKIDSNTILLISDTNFINPLKFKGLSLNDSIELSKWYNWDHRDKNLVQMTKSELKKYFQYEKTRVNYEAEDRCYFYSIIRNTPSIKMITVLEDYDACCVDLYLLTYDKNNKLLSKNYLAGIGGDGGWGYRSGGKFTRDSSYYNLAVINSENELSDNDTSETKTDSTIMKFKIIQGFKFKEVFKKTFSKKEKIVESNTD
jgi:hypothetical protein